MKNQLRIISSFTNTETRSVDLYLNDISRGPFVDAAEEPLLASRIREGDRAALDRLVRANLRFVVSVAKKYQYMGLPLADLIAEGNLGLLAAARKFDATRGFKFISFAVWQIRQYILDAISDHSRTIRLPQFQSDNFREIQKVAATAEQRLERQATPEELAEWSGLSVLQVNNALYYNRKTISFYTAVGGDEAECLLDRMVCDEPDEAWNDYIDLYGRIASLPEREQQIIVFSFGLDGGHPMLPADIAPLMRLSTERVRQLKVGALALLRGGAK